MKQLIIPVLAIMLFVCMGCPPEPPSFTCDNLIKDVDEEGIDCGGTCAPCHEVKTDHELLIRHLEVVNSPAAQTGDLSFGKLMERINPNNAKQTVLDLIKLWETDQTSNDITINARPAVTNQIMSLWRARDGVQNNEQVTLANAPFRLLAITNRVDLMNIGSGDSSAGEGRLTFGLSDNGSNVFTLIFEYKLTGSTQQDVVRWAKRWHVLSKLDKDSPAYLDTLVSIVNSFTAHGSMLNQIRTNEVIGGIEDGTFLWEMREFNLDNQAFVEVSRKKSPTTELNNTQLFRDYIDANRQSILDGIVINEFNSNKVLAGNALYDENFIFTLPDTTGFSNELFTLTAGSCVGCHGGLATSEGLASTRFTHIKPRSANAPAQISAFLEEDVLGRRESILNVLEQPIAASRGAAKSLVLDSLANEEVEKINNLFQKLKKIDRVH